MYLYGVTVGLTFAGLRALRPAVTDVFVANTSAFLEPITARSATTNSTEFLERATVLTHHLIARSDS